MLPQIIATSSMAVTSEEGLQHLAVSCFETHTNPRGDAGGGGPDHFVGQLVQLDMVLRNDELASADLPDGYQLTRSNPEPISAFQLHWSSVDSCQPSYVIVNQDVRDSASRDALIAGVFLGAAAGFVAPLLDKLMAFFSP